MKKLLYLIPAVFLFWSASAHAANYTYYRAITVTSTTSIASGTNANFPMLFSGTYSWLEASSTGGGAGRIQNLVTAPNGGQEPADLVFATSSANCNGTPLPFETESYSSSTGAINDWVKVPSLAASTVIYACYGNSTVSSDQSKPSSTFSNYKFVWHFPNSPGAALGTDSSPTGATLTFSNVTTSTGRVGGGMYDASSTSAATSSVTSFTTATSGVMSLWILSTSTISSGALLNPTGNTYPFLKSPLTSVPYFYHDAPGSGQWSLSGTTFSTTIWNFVVGGLV
jgi:hypothetical protein